MRSEIWSSRSGRSLMVGPKIHLAHRRRGEAVHTACGLTNVPRSTRDPAEVTCERCRSSLALADREAREEVKRKRRGHKKHN